MIKSWLRQQKDASLSMLAEKALQARLERYGELVDLKIDSEARTVQARLLLKGENDPIELFVDKYALIEKDGAVWISVDQVRASREWISQVLSEFAVGHRIQIPQQYGKLVKALL